VGEDSRSGTTSLVRSHFLPSTSNLIYRRTLGGYVTGTGSTPGRPLPAGVHVAYRLLARGPRFRPGEASPIRTEDVAPTLLELVGVPVPEAYESESALPTWEATPPHPRLAPRLVWHPEGLPAARFAAASERLTRELEGHEAHGEDHEDPAGGVEIHDQPADHAEGSHQPYQRDQLRAEMLHWARHSDYGG